MISGILLMSRMVVGGALRTGLAMAVDGAGFAGRAASFTWRQRAGGQTGGGAFPPGRDGMKEVLPLELGSLVEEPVEEPVGRSLEVAVGREGSDEEGKLVDIRGNAIDARRLFDLGNPRQPGEPGSRRGSETLRTSPSGPPAPPPRTPTRSLTRLLFSGPSESAASGGASNLPIGSGGP